MVHDPGARARILERVRALRPDARRRGGRMSVDQMLWHVNQGLLTSLGQLPTEPAWVPLRSVVKPLVLAVRWPKGPPTAREFVAVGAHDFAHEHRRYLELLEDFARRPLEGSFAPHPLFGPMSGRDWSRMHYKHMDHHLRQFGR